MSELFIPSEPVSSLVRWENHNPQLGSWHFNERMCRKGRVVTHYESQITDAPDPNQDLLQKQGLLTGQCFENSIFWGHHFYWEKYSDTVQEKKKAACCCC